MSRDLEARIKAEVQRRKAIGEVADQSGIVSEAVTCFLDSIERRDNSGNTPRIGGPSATGFGGD